MSKRRKKYQYHVPVAGTYRALVGLSIRDDKDGWLNVKAGEEFTPPAQMNVRQHIALGEIEPTKSEVTHE